MIIGNGHTGDYCRAVNWLTFSTRIDDKSAKTVTAATIAFLTQFKGAVLTITAAINDTFAPHKKMTDSLKYDVYFEDPYCLWQL
jgi:IS30 family transposase